MLIRLYFVFEINLKLILVRVWNGKKRRDENGMGSKWNRNSEKVIKTIL